MAAIVAAKDVDGREDVRSSSHGFGSSGHQDPSSSELRDHRFGLGDLLSYPLPVITVEQHAPAEATFEQRLEFDITRGGEARGVTLWLDGEITDSVRGDHAAGATTVETIIDAQPHVLYAWPAAVRVTAGDSIRLSLRTERSGQGYNWHWDSLIRKIESGRIQGIRYQRCTGSPLTLLNGKRR